MGFQCCHAGQAYLGTFICQDTCGELQKYNSPYEHFDGNYHKAGKEARKLTMDNQEHRGLLAERRRRLPTSSLLDWRERETRVLIGVS